VVRQGDLATTAAHIDQQAPALRARLTHHPAMDQACLFEPGDDLHIPTGFGFHPGKKGLCVAGIAQGRCGHRAHVVAAVQLDRPIEALQGN